MGQFSSVYSVQLINSLQFNHQLSTKLTALGALGGLQRVVEVFCVDCGSNVGWRYEVADELSLRYKQKKFMLVRNRLLDPWEHACITGLIDDSDNADDA
ncbi:hypothetical protein BVRB_8g195600 [Beta vulgaris subsp. vulgaris]|nr:hypothetical protein BVRB_8g195600 [Beta vulgaris subsp. vulgaris]